MPQRSQTFSGRGGEFFEGEPRRECVVEREASWKIAKLRDWGRVIDVGEAATGMGCRKSWSVFSVERAVFLVHSIFLIKKYLKC